jgi:diguanylate cyclase (GGDEF)-like protein
VRKSDVPARFGGEEFFIILPETSHEKAEKLAMRLRNVIHSDKLLKKYKITVSGGITEFKPRDTKIKFKERADKALYKAKKEGRDRFIIIK